VIAYYNYSPSPIEHFTQAFSSQPLASFLIALIPNGKVLSIVNFARLAAALGVLQPTCKNSQLVTLQSFSSLFLKK
jgi:hypothetical protein